MQTQPPSEVVVAFGADGLPTRFATGRGATWAIGDVVLKQVDDAETASWTAEFAKRIPQHGFRLATPIASRDGRWVVNGWCAWSRLAGEHSTARWPELLDAAAAFHVATNNEPEPAHIRDAGWALRSPLDRWQFADRVAWGEVPAGEFLGVRHAAALLDARRDIALPKQLIHGDLVGNVLFADDQPPAIIDLSLYWRPAGYSAALVVGDAITWEGAPFETVQLLDRFAEWPQLLLRAVLFRVLVNDLARRVKPWRKELGEEYKPIVDLVLAAARTV